MLNYIKNAIFKRNYIVVSDFIKGEDTRCNKGMNNPSTNPNLYIGINNLNEFQVVLLLKDAYGLVVPVKEVKSKIDELNASAFSNKMITVNMFHYRDTHKEHGNLDSIIVGNNFKKGIHHSVEFDYIDTMIVKDKIVISR